VKRLNDGVVTIPGIPCPAPKQAVSDDARGWLNQDLQDKEREQASTNIKSKTDPHIPGLRLCEHRHRLIRRGDFKSNDVLLVELNMELFTILAAHGRRKLSAARAHPLGSGCSSSLSHINKLHKISSDVGWAWPMARVQQYYKNPCTRAASNSTGARALAYYDVYIHSGQPVPMERYVGTPKVHDLGILNLGYANQFMR
jgi:hypothetical protein